MVEEVDISSPDGEEGLDERGECGESWEDRQGSRSQRLAQGRQRRSCMVCHSRVNGSMQPPVDLQARGWDNGLWSDPPQ